MGLSTDGINPFGEMSSGHGTWPVTLCISTMAMHEAEIHHDVGAYPGPKAARE